MSFHAPLIIDVAGTELNKADKKRLKNPLVGGLILFARNWESREQLTALCHSIKKIRQDLLICVDHEGGRVQRFKTDGFTHLPPMRALGELWMRDAMQASGARTKREAVEIGLRTLVKLDQQQGIKALRGRLPWVGDLDSLRQDQPVTSGEQA